MTDREKLIEAMKSHYRSVIENAAGADFAATKGQMPADSVWAGYADAMISTVPGLSDVIAGKAVIVPVEATAEMQEGIWLAAQLQNANAQYAAMLAASPYAKDKTDEA